MKLGTKVLLIVLSITVGLSAVVTLVVRWKVTQQELRQAHEQIGDEINAFRSRIDERNRTIYRVVRPLLENPSTRSYLQPIDGPADSPDTRNAISTVQNIMEDQVAHELKDLDADAVFHVLINSDGKVLIADAPGNPELQDVLQSSGLHWPYQPILERGELVSQYLPAPKSFSIVLGVPLRAQIDEAPSHAYFIGLRADNKWGQKQFAHQNLCGWIETDSGGHVVRAANEQLTSRGFIDAPVSAFTRVTAPTGQDGQVEFVYDGERFVGELSELPVMSGERARLVLASSLDKALAPLHALQRQILILSLISCVVAAIASEIIARAIARPVRQLVDGTARIAAGQFDQPVQVKRRDELGTLAGSFNRMAAGLKERDSLREQRVKTERDLAVAREIQMNVLPRELPKYAGYELAAASVPAEETGGDIYDVVTVDASSCVLLLADATGHGIGPALSVTQVRAMLRIAVRLGARLRDVLEQINAQLSQDLDDGRFVTAFVGRFESTEHRVRYHSAGQGPLLHFHVAEDRPEWLDPTMPPLGVLDEMVDEGERVVSFAPGDWLLLATDGFYEAQNASGEQFGADRVAACVRRCKNDSADSLIKALFADVRAFAAGAPQADDMTIVCVKRIPN